MLREKKGKKKKGGDIGYFSSFRVLHLVGALSLNKFVHFFFRKTNMQLSISLSKKITKIIFFANSKRLVRFVSPYFSLLLVVV